jgi:NAD-dependent SIR2 family protein deacetylase
VVAVRCQHCGARYDTELPVRAIERIRRCSSCGHPALIADDQAPPAPEPDEVEELLPPPDRGRT